MSEHNYCVIMAGGGGFRFWPIGRASNPKQFLDLSGNGESFLQNCYRRACLIVPPKNILVVTLAGYAAHVKEQIPELLEENLLLEPYGRHTAPCIAYASYKLLHKDPQAVFAAIPSDILIGDETAFQETMLKALDYASRNRALITLGIVPGKPDTNLGYIQVKGGQNSYKKNVPSKVKTFTEKPDQSLAEIFIQSGEFLWNSGIFVWQAAVIKEEMEKHIPQVASLFKGLEKVVGTLAEHAFLEKIYGDMDKISIDYGVMEKTDIAWVYPTRFNWTDLTNWDSLYDFSSKDAAGNVKEGERIVSKDNKNCIIATTVNGKLVAVKGLKNYIVIDTPDALLICPRDESKISSINTLIALPEYEDFR